MVKHSASSLGKRRSPDVFIWRGAGQEVQGEADHDVRQTDKHPRLYG